MPNQTYNQILKPKVKGKNPGWQTLDPKYCLFLNEPVNLHHIIDNTVQHQNTFSFLKSTILETHNSTTPTKKSRGPQAGCRVWNSGSITHQQYDLVHLIS